MTNVLFICSANRLRSPTAEQVFSTWPGIETDSAGISAGATVPLSSEQVAWADLIFVMEKAHRNKLSHQFRAHLKGKRVVCLDIPDDYDFMDPALVRMLEDRVGRFLPPPGAAVSTADLTDAEMALIDQATVPAEHDYDYEVEANGPPRTGARRPQRGPPHPAPSR